MQDVSERTPMRIDKETYLVGAHYSDENIYYNFVLDKVLAQDIDQEKFDAHIKNFTRNRFCSDPDTQILRDYAKHIELHWEYADSQGQILSNFSMSVGACN